MNFETTYSRMIQSAAERLALRMKSTQGRSYVVAVPTRSPAEPGRLDIIGETDPVAPGGRIVRPSDGGGSAERWEAVDRSLIFDRLWQACRREPILPIEEAAQ